MARKRLNEKQEKALELLTCGRGLSYKEIAETVGVSPKVLWEWRTKECFVMFQERLQQLNDERWLATVDAARAAGATGATVFHTRSVDNAKIEQAMGASIPEETDSIFIRLKQFEAEITAAL